jgi:hypothetical protein
MESARQQDAPAAAAEENAAHNGAAMREWEGTPSEKPMNLYAVNRPEFSATPAGTTDIQRALSAFHLLSEAERAALPNSIVNAFGLLEESAHTAAFEIRDEHGATIAQTLRTGRSEFEAECDARMLAFAGKLHWELGNACSSIKCAVQDIRALLSVHANDPEKLQASIRRVAAGMNATVAILHRPYEGALMVGQEAKEFDAAWNQSHTSTPTAAEVNAVLDSWDKWDLKETKRARAKAARSEVDKLGEILIDDSRAQSRGV